MLRLTINIDDELAESLAKVGATQKMTDEQTAAYLLDRTIFGITRRLTIPAADYRPQSVMVMVDDNDDEVLKHFRCPNCGNIVFDYCGATKLIMGGRYDRDTMMIDGQTAVGDGFGRPTRVECQGRVLVAYPNGRTGKIRCGNVFYKLRA
jgi:hypothetical protein